MSTRPFQILLVGATGFAGRLTAHRLAAHAGLRWAIAGRSTEKLEELRADVGGAPAVVPLDLTDATSCARAAAQADVVLTTAGPFTEVGFPLASACVDAGTDYADITGEPAYVARLRTELHAAAEARGVRLAVCCGFDSVPHDLGAHFALQGLDATRPITVQGYVQAKASFSGGTWASALGAMAGSRPGHVLPDEPPGRTARIAKTGLHHIPDLRPFELRGIALPLPTIDPAMVVTTARLDDAYGPAFRYGHFLASRRASRVAGLAAAMGAVSVAARVPPLRKALERIRPRGSGPSEDERAQSWFRVTFLATDGAYAQTAQVRGGDPGYDETATSLAEVGLALTFDRDHLPTRVGVLSPRAAFGDVLQKRLIAKGWQFATGERWAIA